MSFSRDKQAGLQPPFGDAISTLWHIWQSPGSNTHTRQLVCDTERGTNMGNIKVVKNNISTERTHASGLLPPRMERMTQTAECSAFNTDHCTLCWAWQINRLPAQQAPGKETNITAVSLLNLLTATNSETWVGQGACFQLAHAPV